MCNSFLIVSIHANTISNISKTFPAFDLPEMYLKSRVYQPMNCYNWGAILSCSI